MRVLAWALRVTLFVALFLFALKNTDPVTLRLYFEQSWQAPLVLVLLVFFTLGAALGVIATLATIFRQRREIARLQRELRGVTRESGGATQPTAEGSVDTPRQI